MSEMDDARAADLVAASFDTFTPSTPRGSTEEDTLPVRSFLRPAVEDRVEGPVLRRILEAILFATDRPVTVEQLQVALPGWTDDHLVCELAEMAADYDAMEAGFRLLPCAGGWQIRTDPEMHEFVTRFLVGKRRTRLSRAAMETLAIVAYRQPITRGEVEDIRGVDSGQVFHTLLERNLVTVKGRSQALGRPLLYGTTEEFLRYFGLNSLVDLPSPQELEALLGEDPLDDPEIRQALATRGFGPDAGDGDALAGSPGAVTPGNGGASADAIPGNGGGPGDLLSGYGGAPAYAMPGNGGDPGGREGGRSAKEGGEPAVGPCA
jgi:segregation and condensation protein B